YTAWAGSGLAGLPFRGVIAGVCLLPPTLLMGATLPAISRWVEATPEGVSWLGFFYGGQIAGGALRGGVARFFSPSGLCPPDCNVCGRRDQRRGRARRPRDCEDRALQGRRSDGTRARGDPRGRRIFRLPGHCPLGFHRARR